MFGGAFASAVVGGLASTAGGGDFANGAVTAAFGYLFNQVLYQPGEGNPYSMTEEFQRKFAGKLEADIVDLIRRIEQGEAPLYETLRGTDDAMGYLPGGRRVYYDIYKAPSPDGSMGGRIANKYGHNYYYYSPYHYRPAPDVPNAWIQFWTSGKSIYCGNGYCN